jgi:hypothetical protein
MTGFNNGLFFGCFDEKSVYRLSGAVSTLPCLIDALIAGRITYPTAIDRTGLISLGVIAHKHTALWTVGASMKPSETTRDRSPETDAYQGILDSINGLYQPTISSQEAHQAAAHNLIGFCQLLLEIKSQNP